MKNFFGLLVILAGLSGCGDAGNNASDGHDKDQSNSEKSKTSKEHGEKDQHQGAATDEPLKLNNGEKWPTDQSTREGMQAIDSLVASYEKQNQLDLTDYNQLGDGIHERMQKILKACSMEGPAHQELHKFISKIHPHIKGLRGDDEKLAKKSFDKVVKLMDQYPRYFH